MRFSDWSSDVCSSDLSQSGALGIMNSISDVKADGGDLVVSLPEGNADLPLLLSDYHLVIQPNGGVDDPNAGIGTGPYKVARSEEHTSELQSLMRISYADFRLKKKQ